MAGEEGSPGQPDPDLKPDRREILQTILDITGERNRPPTLREVAKVLGRKSPGGLAALVNGIEVEGTIKTLKLIDGRRWLMPQNPAHTPISGDTAEIYGKVVAVLRQV